MSRQQEIRSGLYDHLLAGHTPEVAQLTGEGLASGMKPLEVLFDVLIPALQEVGHRFETGDYFVPEMLISAKAMQEALHQLRPLLAETGVKPLGTVMMMTVKGDLHDIGKNLCNTMLEGAGFTVLDLGVNVTPEKMIAAVRQHRPPVIGFSALLTTTMPMFKVNLEALKRAGLRDQIKVMVGGAPVTQEYADAIGADGYAPDASSAARLAQRLLAEVEARAPAAGRG